MDPFVTRLTNLAVRLTNFSLDVIRLPWSLPRLTICELFPHPPQFLSCTAPPHQASVGSDHWSSIKSGSHRAPTNAMTSGQDWSGQGSELWCVRVWRQSLSRIKFYSFVNWICFLGSKIKLPFFPLPAHRQYRYSDWINQILVTKSSSLIASMPRKPWPPSPPLHWPLVTDQSHGQDRSIHQPWSLPTLLWIALSPIIPMGIGYITEQLNPIT